METIAHLRQNGRLTTMFCAFSGPPRILRLYGRGRVHLAGQRSTLTDWAERRGPDGLADYRVEKNETSIDGLPGHPGRAP